MIYLYKIVLVSVSFNKLIDNDDNYNDSDKINSSQVKPFFRYL